MSETKRIISEEEVNKLLTETQEGRIVRFYPAGNFLIDTPERVIDAFWVMLRKRVEDGHYFNNVVLTPEPLFEIPEGVTVTPEQVLEWVKPRKEKERLEAYIQDRLGIEAEDREMEKWYESVKNTIESGDRTKAIHLINECPQNICKECNDWDFVINYLTIPEVYLETMDANPIVEDEEE